MRRVLTTISAFAWTAVSALLCCAAMAALFTITATVEAWQGEA